MRCADCGFRGELEIEHRDCEYASLPGAILRAVEHQTCPRCGETAVVIPALAQLNRLLAATLVNKLGPLTGAEFRFLRKTLGWSSQDTAKRFGVRPETVSRWEHGERVIGPTADRLIRLCVVTQEPIEDYSADALEWDPGEPTPTRRTFELRARSWRAVA